MRDDFAKIPFEENPLGNMQIVLPDGYKRVKYLESTGTQKIKTDLILNNGDFEVFLDILCKGEDGKQHDFGISTSNGWWVASVIGDGKDYFTMSNSTILSGVKASERAFLRDALTHKDGTTTHTISAEGKSVLKNPRQPLLQIGKEYYLFGYGNGDGGVGIMGTMQMFSAYAFQNGVLFHYFIPALDYDGIPCLFDLISQKPFYNAGSGEFLWG